MEELTFKCHRYFMDKIRANEKTWDLRFIDWTDNRFLYLAMSAQRAGDKAWPDPVKRIRFVCKEDPTYTIAVAVRRITNPEWARGWMLIEFEKVD